MTASRLEKQPGCCKSCEFVRRDSSCRTWREYSNAEEAPVVATGTVLQLARALSVTELASMRLLKQHFVWKDSGGRSCPGSGFMAHGVLSLSHILVLAMAPHWPADFSWSKDNLERQ